MNRVIIIIFSIILIIYILSVCFLSFVKFDPDILVPGCQEDYCVATRCIGYNCKADTSYGAYSQAGDCIGEHCKAGDCYGYGCKAGDCYGYGCKPGICNSISEPTATCEENHNMPNQSKMCTDGKAFVYKPYYKILTYLPYATILNPPMCKSNLTVKDLRDGRVDNLNINSVLLNNRKKSNSYKQVVIDETLLGDTEIVSTYPPVYKNDNCDLCASLDNNEICQNYVPTISAVKKNGNSNYVWTVVSGI